MAFDADVRGLYGAEWEGVLAGAPRSAFVAEGSAVTVYRPRRVAHRAGRLDTGAARG